MIADTGDYHMHVWTDRGRGSYTLTVDLVSPHDPRPDTVDYYSVVVPTGSQYLGVVSANPNTSLSLLDVPGGPVSSIPVGKLAVIAPLEVEPGIYTIAVTSDIDSEYGLAVTIDGAFDITGYNDSAEEAQDITNLAGVVGYVGGSVVGYFTDGSTSSVGPEASILAAGSIPVHITDIASFDFDSVDVLLINNSINSRVSDAVLGRVGDIQQFVEGGGVLVINDRYVNDTESGPAKTHPLLIGRNDNGDDDILLVRDFEFGADIDVIPDPATATTLITNGAGPGGPIDNSTLDGGNYSNHGYALASTLNATGDLQILSAGPYDPGTSENRVAGFAYQLDTVSDAGFVYYSTIPLDFYLGYENNFNSVYAPNLIAYANSLIEPDDDWYKVVNETGDPKTYQVLVPASGDGAFGNRLAPSLQLIDEASEQVIQEATSVSVPADGATYYIRVMAAGVLEPGKTAFGEYILIDPPSVRSTVITAVDSSVQLLVPEPTAASNVVPNLSSENSSASSTREDERVLLKDFSPPAPGSKLKPFDVDALMQLLGANRSERGVTDDSQSDYVRLMEDDPLRIALHLS